MHGESQSHLFLNKYYLAMAGNFHALLTKLCSYGQAFILCNLITTTGLMSRQTEVMYL